MFVCIGCWFGGDVAEMLLPDSISIGKRLLAKVSADLKSLICTMLSVDTMDETYLMEEESGDVNFKGNPTECALLMVAFLFIPLLH